MKDVLAVILGGGRGTRLYPLTRYRSKPAVPIGGKFRLIDIPISNCLHAEIRKIYVLTQFNTASLHRHISQTYQFDSYSDGFLQILAAQQTMADSDWYQGTADAVRKNLGYIREQKAGTVVILSGDQLYRINLRDFVAAHLRDGADLTIAVKPVTRSQAPEFGILKIDAGQRISHFVEKPKDPAVLDEYRRPAAGADEYLASMGIYAFRKDTLVALLERDSRADFGHQIIPSAIGDCHVRACEFHGYWEDIGTIRSFFEANLDFAAPVPRFDFYDEEYPVYTHKRFLPGAKIGDCAVRHALISDGSIIEGGRIAESVVGLRSIIRRGADLERVVMMGADYYETAAEQLRRREQRRPLLGVGAGCVIRNAILDKNVRVGDGVRIVNQRGVMQAQTDEYLIVDGIVVVPKNAELPDGFVI